MNKVTSATIFNDAVGMRVSFTYSVIDEKTGDITQDGIRRDKIITESETIAQADAILNYCQAVIDNEE